MGGFRSFTTQGSNPCRSITRVPTQSIPGKSGEKFMDIAVETSKEGIVIFRLTGKLNMVYAPALRQEIAEQTSAGHNKIVIDMSGVDFMDSSGLGALINGLKGARQGGGDLRIAAPVEQVKLVLKLTNLDRVIKTYSSAEKAFDES